MIDEIIGGLKNALDRGDTLEQAAQSFINSGYNPAEVQEAVKFLTQGATSMLSSGQPNVTALTSDVLPEQLRQGKDYYTYVKEVAEAKKRRRIVVALLVILLILIGALILVLMFKEEIVRALA